MFKLRDIFEQFNFNLSAAFEPGENICIDETLYAFRGRVSFLQYMPKKPSRYGIKINCLVDVDTAYLLFGEIYTGKAEPDAKKETNVSYSLVIRLSNNYLGTHRFKFILYK